MRCVPPPTLERPKKAGLRRLLKQRRDAARADARLAAARRRRPRRRRAGRRWARRHLARFEVAGPGFLNLFLSDDWHVDALGYVLGAGDAFGAGGARPRSGSTSSSSRPTRPGRCTSGTRATPPTATRWPGCWRSPATTSRASSTSTTTARRSCASAESLRARARGEEVAEGGYVGDYVSGSRPRSTAPPTWISTSSAARVARDQPGPHPRVARALPREFDIWFSERSLPRGLGERVDGGRPLVRARPDLHVRRGAVAAHVDRSATTRTVSWCGRPASHTYFASDIAYHQNKRERGFDRLIDVWGADHHGYVHG